MVDKYIDGPVPPFGQASLQKGMRQYVEAVSTLWHLIGNITLVEVGTELPDTGNVPTFPQR